MGPLECFSIFSTTKMPSIRGLNTDQISELLTTIAAADAGDFNGISSVIMQSAAKKLIEIAETLPEKEDEKMEVEEEIQEAADPSDPQDIVDKFIKANPVAVFSKSWCPFCKKAKAVLHQQEKELNVPVKVMELDEMDEKVMGQIQDILKTMTGARSVPRVFIGGKSLGGCDDTLDAYQSGALKKLMVAAAP